MEDKKIKRVGDFTFGCLLILLGIMFIFSIFLGPVVLRYLYYTWPIFLITLGIEVLYYDCKKGYTLKWNVLNIIFTSIIIVGSMIIGTVGNVIHIFINDELIMNKLKNEIYEELNIDETLNDKNTNNINGN